ncbi:MAG: hypothetical protein AAFP97_03925, partial [Pseudomonadota bacterium]
MKSVSGPVASITDPKGPIALPPEDGANLQRVYDDEARYMRLMRERRAEALWYDWVPETSLSVSVREARKLPNMHAFTDE